MARAVVLFGDTRYERLAKISVVHFYNLRKKRGYSCRTPQWQHWDSQQIQP